jgi:hypothetical protein
MSLFVELKYKAGGRTSPDGGAEQEYFDRVCVLVQGHLRRPSCSSGQSLVVDPKMSSLSGVRDECVVRCLRGDVYVPKVSEYYPSGAVQYHSILVYIFVVPVCLVPGFPAALRVTTMAILESMLSTVLAIVLQRFSFWLTSHIPSLLPSFPSTVQRFRSATFGCLTQSCLLLLLETSSDLIFQWDPVP